MWKKIKRERERKDTAQHGEEEGRKAEAKPTNEKKERMHVRTLGCW